jgi:hypothetical protein
MNNHIPSFDEFLNESSLQGTPKFLPGKAAIAYGDEEGKIVAAEFAKDWKKLKKYDETGWLDPTEMKNMGIEPTDILVAFKDSEGGINVYTYGEGGVELK